MPLTQIPGPQVKDGTIQRVDLDIITPGQSLVRKVAVGTGLSETYDGADLGTGDVTISAPNAPNWDAAFTQRLQWDGGGTNLVAATGRTSLGATTLGGNIFTIGNNALGVAGFMQISSTNVPTLKNAANTLADLGGVSLSGSYADPAWITSLAWSKITGAPATGVSSVFGRAGAVVAAEADYQSYYPRLSQVYANPNWISSLAWSKITAAPAFEPALGNPSVDGYILSSTTAGVRSWIAPPSGGGGTITLSGDVTGSGTTSIVTNIATGVITANEIAANAIGASEINNTQDLALAAKQTITMSDTGTTNIASALDIRHATSGVAAANFGTGITFSAETSTGAMQFAAQLAARWSDATDTTRTSYYDFLSVKSGGSLASCGKASADGWDIKGTTSNDAAATGYVGESKQTLELSTAAATLTSNSNFNVTTISLTAGDWDVSGIINFTFTNATSVNTCYGTLNSGSLAMPDDGTMVYGFCFYSGVANTFGAGLRIPSMRFSLNATTTIYLVAKSLFSPAGAAKAFGSIFARRIR